MLTCQEVKGKQKSLQNFEGKNMVIVVKSDEAFPPQTATQVEG